MGGMRVSAFIIHRSLESDTTMNIRYGIIGILIITAFLVGRWQSGNQLAQSNVPDKLQTQPQKLPNLQGRSNHTAPSPESNISSDGPLNGSRMIELPPLSQTASVPRDTGPFIDATPGKITQRSDSSPPRDTGPFLDAGDPTANAN